MTAVNGVGPARARLLARLGIETVAQLLRTPPRDYMDAREHTLIRDLETGGPVTVAGRITESGWRRARHDRSLWIGTIVLQDRAGDTMDLISFVKTRAGRRPRPLAAADPRRKVAVSGVPRRAQEGRWQMQSPDIEPVSETSLHTGRIVPIYSLTEGLTQKLMRRIVRSALDEWARQLDDVLPRHMTTDSDLPDLAETLEQLHYPDNWETLHAARQRLAFEELLLLRLAVALESKQRAAASAARSLSAGTPAFVERLPFALTEAQQRVLQEVDADLARPAPMQRLLQGDVGSGKTVVAAYALAKAVLGGGQGALLAPSDVLARQHATSLKGWFAPDGIPVALLRGATEAMTRQDILKRLAAGEPLVVVGTHALLQKSVQFRRLDVVVVDEQHRFGVEQRRALLRAKKPPHMLIISATPIPRTLAHCVYGELDVSVLDEMPPGRLPVDTRWVRPTRRDDVYRFVRQQVEAGGQAFVVFPEIGDGQVGDGQTVDVARGDDRLLHAAAPLQAGPLHGLRVQIVHGRQPSDEQAEVFAGFRRGEIDVLLATSVIEVGVDVPRASVIVIEGADKFGLAQLHQLRGRVGRGGGQAYCFLVADPRTDTARRRLQAMRQTTDGFALAEHDFVLRGPGELLGLRQSGLPDVSPLALSADMGTLELTRRWAERLLAPSETPRPDEAMLWDAVRRRIVGSTT